MDAPAKPPEPPKAVVKVYQHARDIEDVLAGVVAIDAAAALAHSRARQYAGDLPALIDAAIGELGDALVAARGIGREQLDRALKAEQKGREWESKCRQMDNAFNQRSDECTRLERKVRSLRVRLRQAEIEAEQLRSVTRSGSIKLSADARELVLNIRLTDHGDDGVVLTMASVTEKRS